MKPQKKNKNIKKSKKTEKSEQNYVTLLVPITYLTYVVYTKGGLFLKFYRKLKHYDIQENKKVLKLENEEELTLENIKKAARKQHTKYHPDKHRNKSKEEIDKLQNKFNEVTQAQLLLKKYIEKTQVSRDDYNSKINLFYTIFYLIVSLWIILIIALYRLLFVSNTVFMSIAYVFAFDLFSAFLLVKFSEFYKNIDSELVRHRAISSK